MEENKLDPQTVFRITHDEIKATGRTQCPMDKHAFRKLSDNEIHCDICQSTYIIDPDKMNEYVN